MKKILAMLLALVMVLSLAACGASNDAPATEAPTTEAAGTEATEAPATEAERPHFDKLTLEFVPSKDADVIIIEGMKESGLPKIEVVRQKISSTSICDPDTLILIATDVVSPKEVSCPVYGLDDTEGIFLCLKQYFGLT